MDTPLDSISRQEPLQPGLSVLVKSAVPLNQDQKSAIEQLCRNRYGSIQHLLFEVDPDVIGGIWLRVGDIVIDGSIAGRLEQLSQALKTQLRAEINAHLQSEA